MIRLKQSCESRQKQVRHCDSLILLSFSSSFIRAILVIYHCSISSLLLHHHHLSYHSCCCSSSVHSLSVSSTDCCDWELHFIRLWNLYILTNLKKLIKFVHIISFISFILICLVHFVVLHYYIYALQIRLSFSFAMIFESNLCILILQNNWVVASQHILSIIY